MEAQSEVVSTDAEEVVEAKDLSVSQLSSIYQQTVEGEKKTNWTRGEIAVEVLDRHNKDKKAKLLQSFLSATGESRSAFYQYGWVYKAFKDTKVRDLPGLVWSHYRAASGAENPSDWIVKAHDNKWSSKKLIDEIEAARAETRVENGMTCLECDAKVDKTSMIVITAERHRNFFCSKACGAKWLAK